MTNETKQTAIEDLETQIEKLRFQGVTEWQCGYQKALNEVLFLLKQAKEMEKEKHEKFNKFLNDEKQLGISNLKTIERIQWYYNTYFNETYGGNK